MKVQVETYWEWLLHTTSHQCGGQKLEGTSRDRVQGLAVAITTCCQNSSDLSFLVCPKTEFCIAEMNFLVLYPQIPSYGLQTH